MLEGTPTQHNLKNNEKLSEITENEKRKPWNQTTK
jgi:hypothetical protein